jgi:hypothetical protein
VSLSRPHSVAEDSVAGEAHPEGLCAPMQRQAELPAIVTALGDARISGEAQA